MATNTEPATLSTAPLELLDWMLFGPSMLKVTCSRHGLVAIFPGHQWVRVNCPRCVTS